VPSLQHLSKAFPSKEDGQLTLPKILDYTASEYHLQVTDNFWTRNSCIERMGLWTIYLGSIMVTYDWLLHV